MQAGEYTTYDLRGRYRGQDIRKRQDIRILTPPGGSSARDIAYSSSSQVITSGVSVEKQER